METAFREIEKQTGFSFIYGKEQVINSNLSTSIVKK